MCTPNQWKILAAGFSSAVKKLDRIHGYQINDLAICSIPTSFNNSSSKLQKGDTLDCSATNEYQLLSQSAKMRVAGQACLEIEAAQNQDLIALGSNGMSHRWIVSARNC